MKQAKTTEDFQLYDTMIMVEAGTEVDILPAKMGCTHDHQTVRLAQAGLVTNLPKAILHSRPA